MLLLKKIIFSAVILFCVAFEINAQIKTAAVAYKDGNQELEGFLAYDSKSKEKKPVIIVVHEWTGINDYIKKRCQQLAELGYLAFAVDIFGKGVRPSTPDAAGKESGKYRENRPLLRQRMVSGFEFIKKNPLADTTRIAAIGYCFGGTAVLELARTGADFDGAISFHGGLSNPSPQDVQKIKPKVLICHGAVDPFVPQEEVLNFLQEMNDAKKDYQFNIYSKAVHSFTNPDAMSFLPGVAYNKEADLKSWEDMKIFFKEVLK